MDNMQDEMLKFNEPHVRYPVASIQWAPSGNALEGIPGHISRFLADENGRTPGYAPGPGWSFVWHHGDGITLLPAQFLVKYNDGTFEVSDTDPLTMG